ncbi:MAG TPA: polyketide synthase, partial [Symbiobacteriaceae bacterium]|nr:polyketide synthase [Symbiobacteriaceae bacterium]
MSEGLTGLEIAIVGMAGRFPGADDVDRFWRNLKAGLESISFFTDEELQDAGIAPALLSNPHYVKAKGVLADVDRFDAAFFGYYPREAAVMDPQHRIFLEVAWEALERAGYDPESYPGLVGVFAGVAHNSYLLRHLAPRPEFQADPFQVMLANDKDALATRVAYKLNLRGPALTVQTACSTSLVAVHLACQSLLSGECDMALAGGVSVMLPQKHGYLYQEGMIFSPDGHCRAFDARAGGTVFGDGAALVVLRRL